MSNTINSSALLTQLRTMASEAGLSETNSAVAEKNIDATLTDFTEVLKASVEHVNDRNTEANAIAAAFERGDPDVELSQVMLEMQKARISFETLSQVRNKVISAYQDIMNMPI